MAYRRCVLIAVLCLGPMCAAVPARAERIPLDGWGPFELRPGDVLRATFDVRWFPEPQSLATFDSLQFMPGISAVQPVGSYSTRLSDRGRLLGTYRGTGANAAQMGFGSWFAARSPQAVALVALTSQARTGTPARRSRGRGTDRRRARSCSTRSEGRRDCCQTEDRCRGTKKPLFLGNLGAGDPT